VGEEEEEYSDLDRTIELLHTITESYRCLNI
jgi:hypothetical protein